MRMIGVCLGCVTYIQLIRKQKTENRSWNCRSWKEGTGKKTKKQKIKKETFWWGTINVYTKKTSCLSNTLSFSPFFNIIIIISFFFFFYFFQLKLSDSVLKSNRILYTSLFISVNMTNETCRLRILVLSRASIYATVAVAVAVVVWLSFFLLPFATRSEEQETKKKKLWRVNQIICAKTIQHLVLDR